MEKESMNVCRLCLIENELTSNIFDNQRKILECTLIECIEYIALSRIDIKIDDSHSKLICHKCNYLVEQSFRFLKTIEQSNVQLTEQVMRDEELVRIDAEEDEQLSNEKDNWCVEVLDDKIKIESDGEPTNTDFNQEDPPELNNSYKCPVCGVLCGNSLDAAVKHVTQHNSIAEEDINCDNCSLTFSSKNEYDQHTCEVLMFSCPSCSSQYIDELDLAQHIKECHRAQPAVTSEEIQCSFCPQKFSTHVKRKFHENKHHIIGANIQCPHCPKKFFFNSGLKRHLQSHTGKKLFKCDLCEKRFASQAEVNRHRKYHTNERHHKCTICDKRFIESGHLLNHVNLVHLDNKKYECVFCGKKFLTNFKLKRHQKTRTCEMVSLLKKMPDNEPIPSANEMVPANSSDADDVAPNAAAWKILNLGDEESAITTEINGRKVQVIGIHNENNEIQDYLLLESSLDNDSTQQQIGGSSAVAAAEFIGDQDMHFMNWDREII